MRVYIIFFFLSFHLWGLTQNHNIEVKPYNEIITSETISKKGFLTTHLLNNKLYLEISPSMLDKEMLFVRHGKNEKQIKWVKSENNIQLVIKEVESKAGNIIPLIHDKFNVVMTPASFPVLARGNNQLSYVIDVTNLFLNTPKGLNDTNLPIVDDLAFINKIAVFDVVIDIKTTKTLNTESGPLTINDDFSLVLLPEPMMPRLYDYRMGFFTEERNFGQPKRAAITKWRLEKKEKSHKISEPIEPIIFYLDPKIPDKWKTYVKAGVYEWLPAFESAGFRKAIVIKEVPLNDSDWSINSMRYSWIRWHNRSEYRGHEGEGSGNVNTIIDQRTGEILKGDIIIGSINNLVNRYFTRCSPLDVRAQQYPFTDDLMGELIQSLTAHEAGHVFGLQDGNYGEFTYPFEKMRDKQWLQEMGHTPSIMTYARGNFIAQPEDSIPPKLLQQKVGPTDLYSIRWAYTQFQDINSPDDELQNLEKIVREQDSFPWYRFNLYSYHINGPGSTNEVVESNNPVKTTTLGIQNLKRVIKLIPKATKNERDNKVLERLYMETLNLWVDQMKLVVSLIGGYTIQYKSGSQKGYVYTPVPKDRQKEAVAFLNKNAFSSIFWLEAPEITRRFETNGTLNNISQRQLKVLNELLSSNRLKNLEEVSLTEEVSYGLNELFEDLQEGLWGELEDENMKINPYRQEIQIAFITILKNTIKKERPKSIGRYRTKAFNKYDHSNFTRGKIFNTLNNLKNLINKVIENVNDTTTNGHLKLCLLELNEIQ